MTAHNETGLKVNCQRDDLLAALQTADAIVPSTSSKPILTNLRLVAAHDQLDIFATDNQVGLRAIIRRLEVQHDGDIVVPARTLVGMLKESRSDTVLLTEQVVDGGSQLFVELSDGSYRIPCVVGEAFPEVSGFPEGVSSIRLSGADLEQMIRKTAFAVDRDRSSAVLSGVCFKVGDGEAILAATDGKVLAEAVVRDAAFDGIDSHAIIPASTIAHINRTVGSVKPDTVEICIYKKLISVRLVSGSGGPVQIELTSRLVEGSYPSYRNALPNEPLSTVTFKTSEIASAVKRTALMTSNASRAMVLELSQGESILSNLNHTSGSARIPVSCQYDGGPERLGLNANYMTEIFRAYDGDEVSFELNGRGRGLIAREPGVTYLIMPISLPN